MTHLGLLRGTAATLVLLVASSASAADGPAPASSPVDDGFVYRLYHAYADEFGPPLAADPNAPPSRRPTAEMGPQPVDSPPYPYTDWPFGGASTIGATLPNSVDNPLQKALLPNTSSPGKFLEDHHIQIYGWTAVGGNLSSAKTGYGGNFPAAYSYSPNLIQLDQAVLIVERLPDTVQKDHIDWGFRVSGLYGENYRYTTALGVFSNQLLYHNHFAGYDTPMVYGELYFPQFAEGLVIRAGRFLSIPDIESELAPSNYTYSRSMTYWLDAYTNTGVLGTLKINKNLMVQLGLVAGSDTVPWNAKQVSLINPVTGTRGYTGQRDPGTKPSVTGCVQYQTDSANDALYLCANGINGGSWGYDNLQWYGGTYLHKFSENLHVSLESYYMYQKNVFDVSQGYGNTAFAYMVNPPFEARCPPGQAQCTAKEYGAVAFLNYKLGPKDNVTGRAEFYNDENGQRTGTATRYVNFAIGEQHFFSPSIELRPEVAFYNALNAPAFDNGTKHAITVASMDLIVHF